MAVYTTFLHRLTLILIGLHAAVGFVLELDSRASENWANGPWIVKFYAPWCGYCRKLEPIYSEVGKRLLGTEFKVARIDATAYPDVASAFQVRGYPTIKYIHGDTVFTHNGDRTADNIIQFAKKSHGPAVRKLSSVGKFKEASQEHKEDTFFLYVGPSDSQLREHYQVIANDFRLKTFFYEGELNVISNDQRPKDLAASIPSVLVFKDGASFAFQAAPDQELNVSLSRWVSVERFVAFPKVSEIDLYDFLSVDKLLVIFVINETALTVASSNKLDEANRKFKQMGESLAKRREENITDRFQLVWMVDVISAGHLAMTSLPPPNLIVTRSDSQIFYLTPDYGTHLDWSEVQVRGFLADVAADRVTGYGGSGFLAKLKRLGYDFITGLIDFIASSPLLSMFVIGIPIGVVSFVCYIICCMDTVDDDDDIHRMTPEERHARKMAKKPFSEVPLLSCEEIKAKCMEEKKKD